MLVPGTAMDGVDAAAELTAEVSDTPPEVLGEEPVGRVGPDDDEPDDDESDGSAHVTPHPVATAAPTPSARANAPTRPM